MKKVKENTIVIIIVGFGIVFISAFIHHNPDGFPWKDLVRDIGIALMVAGIISIAYEWNTRETESKLEMKSVLDRVLAAFIPDTLWNEVQSEIFTRKAFRTDMNLQIELYSDSIEMGGNIFVIPHGQRVLKSVLSYKLKGMSSSKHHVDIVHHLDIHMKNDNLKMPRFIKALVTDENGHVSSYTDKYLATIVNSEKGILTIPSNRCPSILFQGKGVKVEIERYEIVNAPGLYTMILPEMVIPSDNNPSVVVSYNKQLNNENELSLEIETWFNTQKHNFEKEANADLWKFKSIMLPGQGFSIIFNLNK